MAKIQCSRCPQMFRNASGLEWHETRQHQMVADHAMGRDQTRAPSDQELLRDIVDTMKMQSDSRKRQGEELDSLNERMGALEAQVSSLTESDLVDALEGTEREPKGWWPGSPC